MNILKKPVDIDIVNINQGIEEKNVDFEIKNDGSDIVTEKECKELCESNEECLFINYKPLNKKCYIITEENYNINNIPDNYSDTDNNEFNIGGGVGSSIDSGIGNNMNTNTKYNKSMIENIKSIKKFIKQNKKLKNVTQTTILDTWCGKNNISYVKDYNNKITKKCKKINSKKEWEKEIKHRNNKKFNQTISNISPYTVNNKYTNVNYNSINIDGGVGNIGNMDNSNRENILISQIDINNYNPEKNYLINLSDISNSIYDNINKTCEEGCNNYFISDSNFNNLKLENNNITFEYLIIESPGVILNSLKRNKFKKLQHNNNINHNTWDNWCNNHGYRPWRWVYKRWYRRWYKHYFKRGRRYYWRWKIKWYYKKY